MIKLLRVEGLAILVIALGAYRYFDLNWLWFLLILAPDLSMLGYLKGPKLGAIIYNLGHSYIFPLGLLFIYFFSRQASLLTPALIWLAHIGMDRAFGFGLKNSTGFKDTHLGKIGKS